MGEWTVATEAKINRNWIIGGIAGFVILAAIGIIAIIMGRSSDAKPTNDQYSTVSASGGPTSQPGSVTINPQEVTLTRGPDGKVTGQAIVSALDQDFKFGEISVKGDGAVTYASADCPAIGSVLSAGKRCTMTLTYDENKAAQNAAAASHSAVAAAAAAGQPAALVPVAPVKPTLHIAGTSKTAGGGNLPVEADSTIVGGTPANLPAGQTAANGLGGAPGAAGAAGVPYAAGAAPAGVDPYGPVAANGTAPPVNPYAQNAQPEQPRLSLRDQFILARRQAVLGNIVGRGGNQTVAADPNDGSWDQIGVPKAVSSSPQDMSRVVTMDRIITAVLVRPYDSRTSQQVVAQVDRNVYGAAGRTILIPRGSTIIGQAAGGQERVAMTWTQIIRPDGARFVLKATSGDAMGQGDVPGYINHRYLQRIGQVLLGTVIKAGTAVASNAQQPSGSGLSGGTGQNNGAIVTSIVSTDVDNILNNILKQNIQQIVTVPAGTRITVVPQQDLVMRPMQRDTVKLQSYPRLMNGGAAAPTFTPEDDADDSQGGDIAPARQRRIPNQGAPAQAATLPPAARAMTNVTPAAAGSAPPWSRN